MRSTKNKIRKKTQVILYAKYKEQIKKKKNKWFYMRSIVV